MENRRADDRVPRVLMATNAMELGGAETHVIELTRGLRRLGYRVAVASGGGALVAALEQAGAAHYRLPLDRRALWPMARSFFALLGLARRQRPDLLHAHARIPALLLGLVSQLTGIPLVTTVHWPFDLKGWKRPLSHWSRHSIAVSEDLRDYLVKNFGLPPQQVAVIPNGINTEIFAPRLPDRGAYQEFGWDEDDPVVVHVSRLTGAIAGPAFQLLPAVCALGKEIPNLRLLVAGDGDRRGELEQLADAVNRELGRPAVRIAGPRRDLPRLLPAASVFVGVSRAALEAMACARPVILAGSQGYMGIFQAEMLPEAIRTNFTGRGWPEVTAAALTHDLREILLAEPAYRDRLGQFNRQVVEQHYSSRIMAEKTHQFYRSVLETVN